MEFHELLERIGVDAPATVARLGGMESILRRFILKFPQDPTFSALAHAYDIRDMKALERHVHTLKGLTANLGAAAPAVCRISGADQNRCAP